MTIRRLSRRTVALSLGATPLLAPAVVSAQGANAAAYPSKQIRIVVNFPPGGTVDVLGRSIGEKLSEVFGQPVIIDNRAGASGNIGADAVAKAPADGYTLLMTNGATLTTNPHLYANTPFDPMRDFAIITQVARIFSMLVVHPSVPVKTAAEFLAYARSNPGKLTFGTAGNGSGPHLAAEMMNRMAGLSTVHVPYKGITPAINDLVAGQTSFMFVDGGGYPFVENGKLRLLAVAGSARLQFMPDTPAMAEAGIVGFQYDSAHTLAMPAGTPKEIVTRLNTEVVKILRSPALVERIRVMVAEVIANSPEEATAATRADYQRIGQLLKELGVRAD